MNSNPASDARPRHELQARPRFADLAKLRPSTLNSWSFLFFAIATASNAYSCDLLKPMDRLGVCATGLAAVLFGILAVQEQLEQRMATLLDRLEQKGVLSAEERAAIGIVHPKTVDAAARRGIWRLALIILGGAAILIVLGFFFATCSRTG